MLSASITLPSEPLASGLVLLDTPGIGGVYTEHTAATNAVLPLADAIVFVADVHRPLTVPELRFLKRATEVAEVGNDRDALICVLTRIDQQADYERTVADAQATLAAEIGWPVPVVPVSSVLKLKYLASRDETTSPTATSPRLRGCCGTRSRVAGPRRSWPARWQTSMAAPPPSSARTRPS